MNHFNEGNKLYTEKQFQKAIDSYKLSIASNSNVPCSYYNIGVCYIKLRDFDSAIKMIKKSLEFQKESKYYFNLAYCYAMKQESNKALIYFNLAWALDSSDLDCEKAIKLILFTIHQQFLLLYDLHQINCYQNNLLKYKMLYQHLSIFLRLLDKLDSMHEDHNYYHQMLLL